MATSNPLGRIANFGTTTRALAKRFWTAFYAKCKRLFVWLKCFVRTVFHGAEKEAEKPVVSSTWGYALWHCGIHIIPLLATIALAYFNFHGLFIGNVLQSLYNDTAQAIDRLSLQVAAKLLELLIIASLGVVIMDTVRDKLLFDDNEGIPLGLVTAKSRFADITYLLSHDFRAGCWGFQKRRTRILFISLITVYSLIAILAGPSTALLLIPAYYTSWPARSVSFWFNGDLQPAILDQNYTGISKCTDYANNSTLLSDRGPPSASCIWAGQQYLSTALRQRAYYDDPDISYTDSKVKQVISLTWGVSNFNIWSDTVRVTAVAIPNAGSGPQSFWMDNPSFYATRGLREGNYPALDKQDLFIAVGSIVASFVVDGMSRIGYVENHIDALNTDLSSDAIYKKILHSGLELDPIPALRQSGQKYVWSATVEGYGMKATSTAYYLAFTVLSVYVLVVLVHISYTLFRRRVSDSWSTLTDLLVLSQSSPAPADVLRNTSAGIATHGTLKTQLTIRENPGVTVDQEKLQLLFGEDGKAPTLKKIRQGNVYGVKS
ncbi:uncharacterized protein BDZ99DRAFT_523721 [Mytilinidion resinicola]|uniref:Uncharacterized protein n=1 Tax=Mytilinidion resinicola TaxID=574789 RepID=A0A6A6YCD0_9PEZI|nr:uncharacterized protein BDZ99DRAFT_523721 [Mytilinidion resinicola]KAF2806259.1 hypothetical protein BDZ99DRAFT_523721 [Mytilinidion resinicola]